MVLDANYHGGEETSVLLEDPLEEKLQLGGGNLGRKRGEEKRSKLVGRPRWSFGKVYVAENKGLSEEREAGAEKPVDWQKPSPPLSLPPHTHLLWHRARPPARELW